MLDALGLVPAIEWQATEVQARSNLRCQVSAPEVQPAINPEHNTALFRIVQEALTNVVRHADASNVSISLEQKNNALVLSVHDDGRGFDVDLNGTHPSLGILGMRERTSMIGATFELQSQPGTGTGIIVTVPLDKTVGADG